MNAVGHPVKTTVSKRLGRVERPAVGAASCWCEASLRAWLARPVWCEGSPSWRVPSLDAGRIDAAQWPAKQRVASVSVAVLSSCDGPVARVRHPGSMALVAGPDARPDSGIPLAS